MSAGEKKVAVVLVVILIAMVVAYVSTGKKPQARPVMAQRPGRQAARQSRGTGPTVIVNPGQEGASGQRAECPAGTEGSASGVATQEFGKKGARLEVLALLPITHGCHVQTEAELKKAYQKHPNDIHLTIVDLFGSDAAEYLPKVGNRRRAVVSINGKSEFEVKGRRVVLEEMENRKYSPEDIGPILEAELRK